MISYRFRRRSFLAALGGGFGLRAVFRTAELAAQTARSPPRFLFTHWPLGIAAGAVDSLWTPTMGAAGGHALQTFADNGLADEMIALRSLSTAALQLKGGGGGEGGLVQLVTGVDCGGTRANRGESDDAFAAGPSLDQLLLAKVPELRAPGGGPGYANAICDARTDLGEISSKCLSYSTETQPVPLFFGGTGTENKPLLGTLSPLVQYTNLFSSLSPGPGGGGAGGGSVPVADAMLKQLALKRSVLDFSLGEIARMKALVPSSARNNLQIHADAVAEAEASLSKVIRTRYPMSTGEGGHGGASAGGAGDNRNPPPRCGPALPPPNVQGLPDWTTGGHGNYGNPKNGSTDDMTTHAAVGGLHMDVLRAAFVCDLIRCGTFQWSPATNHVGFKGLYPGDEEGIYQHHPTSHSLPSQQMESLRQARTPDDLIGGARFLFNVQTWYFARHAENIKRWKDAVDGAGNPLLETTLIPFATENADMFSTRQPLPCLLFGGKKLGMNLGQQVTKLNPIGSLFGTIGQAYGLSAPGAPFGAAIPGLWSKPT